MAGGACACCNRLSSTTVVLISLYSFFLAGFIALFTVLVNERLWGTFEMWKFVVGMVGLLLSMVDVYVLVGTLIDALVMKDPAVRKFVATDKFDNLKDPRYKIYQSLMQFHDSMPIYQVMWWTVFWIGFSMLAPLRPDSWTMPYGLTLVLTALFVDTVWTTYEGVTVRKAIQKLSKL
jgi:hypothetical protein